MLSNTVAKDLSDFLAQLEQCSQLEAGYPVNLSYNYSELLPVFNYSLNNAGDPFDQPHYLLHSRQFEQKVLTFFAKLYQMPKEAFWGYVTSGGTEGNLYGLFIARELYPEGILYFSQDSHYSIAKAARLLRVKSVIVPALVTGEIDYRQLEELLLENRDRPAIINLNIGTTMKGAIDNLDTVLEIIEKNNIQDYYIHCDAALAGMMLPFISDAPHVNFTKPIGSISISGHKFIGSPMPCGIVLTRKEFVSKVQNEVEYIHAKDTTILGSRNGHSALILWYDLKTRETKGIEEEVNQCLNNAKYLVSQLKQLNYPSLLNKFSTTVVFKKPPEQLVKKWQLATEGDWAHIVVMQNIDKTKIDCFLDDLKQCTSDRLSLCA